MTPNCVFQELHYNNDDNNNNGDDDDVMLMILDIDECALGEDNCHSILVTCSDEVGGSGSFICTCKTGYTGDGVTCNSMCKTHPTRCPSLILKTLISVVQILMSAQRNFITVWRMLIAPTLRVAIPVVAPLDTQELATLCVQVRALAY